MSSCVSKIMERMINERLMWWSEKQRILDNWQNGFRRGKSCLDNLTRGNRKLLGQGKKLLLLGRKCSI